MKKTTIAKCVLLIACLALTAACAKEKLSKKYIQSQGDVTFYAYDAEANSTKTTLDGTAIKWCPGDQIMVYQGTLSSGKFTSTATETCATTSFSGNIPYIIGGQEADPETSNIWAVYPYSAANGCDGSSVSVNIDAVQTAQAGTFASGIFPAVAKSDKYSLAFYNICGGVKFTVAQSGIKKVVFKGKNSEELAGTVNVSFADGLPVINDVTGAVDSIIVNAPTSDGFIPGDEYFIVAIPAEFTDGFTITYSNDYGATKYAAGFAVKIKRKTFGVVSQKDTVGILFRDPVAKAACVEKFDLNSDGEVSFTEAKVPTTLEGLFEYHDEVQYFPELENFTAVTDLKGCFNGCSQLLEVEIPAFINAIGEKSFYGCSSLAEIEIPTSVKSIGAKAFYGCSAFTEISIPSGVQSIGAEAFRNCTLLSYIDMSEGVKTLGSMAFYGIGARAITLPASVAEIGTKTFWNEVEEIVLNGATPPIRSELSFGTSTLFYVPDDALTIYKNADVWTYFEECIFPVSEYEGTNLSENGTANCYIVNRYGVYHFNATVKGCSSESIGIPASAEVLWESYGTQVGLNVGDVISGVSYKNANGIVKFRANADGNAVIAVKDIYGTIIWSWHIWICEDYDPDKSAQTYKNGDIMMDRNLGSVSSAPGAAGSCGLLYQWGRKDPFLGGSSTTDLAVSTIIWPSVEQTADHLDNNNALKYAISHPLTVLCNPYYPCDWYCSSPYTYRNDDLWSSEEKSMYDPCPIGWCVPAYSSSDEIYNDGPWDDLHYGMNFGSDNGQSESLQFGPDAIIWYPAAGNLSDTGSLEDVGHVGRYWSCTPSYTLNRCLYFKDEGGYVEKKRDSRQLGMSVRCCKE